MLTEAAGVGFYERTVWQAKYPKLQIRTVAELLEGRGVERPPTVAIYQTFKRAPKLPAKGTSRPIYSDFTCRKTTTSAYPDHVQALLDSDAPDWSTVTLDQAHDAVNNLKVQLAKVRGRKPADLDRRRLLGGYITTLMRVRAQKWAERGGSALIDAIHRTRASLRKTDRLGLYSQLYLGYLIEEGEKAGILEPGQNEHLKKLEGF